MFLSIIWETEYVDIWGLTSDLFFLMIDLILVALNYVLKFFSVSFHCMVSLATSSAWKIDIYSFLYASVFTPICILDRENMHIY